MKNVVCFRSFASVIISAKWYSERSEDIGEESKRVVAAAAKLIKDQIAQQRYKLDEYPSLGDNEKLKSVMPQLLLLFMQELVSDELKQVAIASSIAQASKPKSYMSPVLFGLGVEMDMKFRSKWLLNRLSKMGFSISYEEVSNYKKSLMASNQSRSPTDLHPEFFTQWIADNVDHNTITLDGLNTIHAMGIVSASVRIGSFGQGLDVSKSIIPRIKRTAQQTNYKVRAVPILS
jgi:hypothetical protein